MNKWICYVCGEDADYRHIGKAMCSKHWKEHLGYEDIKETRRKEEIQLIGRVSSYPRKINHMPTKISSIEFFHNGLEITYAKGKKEIYQLR